MCTMVAINTLHKHNYITNQKYALGDGELYQAAIFPTHCALNLYTVNTVYR